VIGTPHDERSSKRTWNPDNYTVANSGGGATGETQIDGALHENIDLNLHEEMMDNFRHPMENGGTRQNILWSAINQDD